LGLFPARRFWTALHRIDWDLERRLAEHRRSGNHTTHRFGNDLELIASARANSIAEARILEIQLKSKKNPRIAIAAFTSLSQK
jgi:predicted GIY-YIG superfamily endonuclease